MDDITVNELKEKIESDVGELLILDVREPFEQYQSKIEYDNSILIPVDRLPNRLDELDGYEDHEIVCLCRSGSRSAKARDFLQEQGFDNVRNLKGGINEWARQIDDSMPVY